MVFRDLAFTENKVLGGGGASSGLRWNFDVGGGQVQDLDEILLLGEGKFST